MSMEFSGWLRTERERLKLTQGELAERSGVSSVQISRIENGHHTPRVGTVARLRQALSSEPTVLQATTQASSFPLGRKLGSGAFGDVYEATDEDLGRKVAIKILREAGEGVLSAKGHARGLARGSHPNIVQIFQIARLPDPQTGKDRDAIVMEFVGGGSLEQRLAGPRFSPTEVDALCWGIAEAVACLHDHGVVHQDLHEGNILVALDGEPKLIDAMHISTFASLSSDAIARRIADDCGKTRLLLVQVLKHADSAYPVLSLQDARPATMEEVFALLEEVLSPPPAADPRNTPSPAAPARDRSRLLVGAAAALLALVLVVAVMSTGQPGEPAAGQGSAAAYLGSPDTASASPAEPLPPEAPSRTSASPEPCVLGGFGAGAARRYLATAATEQDAQLLQTRVNRLLADAPGGSAWTTAVRRFRADRSGNAGRWVVFADGMSPASAETLCDWLVRCRGWPEYCRDQQPI